jgi:hypothetical protein
MSNEKLIASFNEGLDQGKANGRFSTRLTVKEGKLRNFWEAGFHKGKAAYDVEAKIRYNSPEARAERKRQDEHLNQLLLAMKLMNTGNYTEASKVLNKSMGF